MNSIQLLALQRLAWLLHKRSAFNIVQLDHCVMHKINSRNCATMTILEKLP